MGNRLLVPDETLFILTPKSKVYDYFKVLYGNIDWETDQTHLPVTAQHLQAEIILSKGCLRVAPLDIRLRLILRAIH